MWLNGEAIVRDVLTAESHPEGVRLTALLEAVQVVPAVIGQIDLIKHIVVLASLPEGATVLSGVE